MTNGEIPAMAIIDSIVRLMPGTINNLESALSDSFSNELLDHPHYTQPREFREITVPDILLSGDHSLIAKWRYSQRKIRTKNYRPDLWETYVKTKELEKNNE